MFAPDGDYCTTVFFTPAIVEVSFETETRRILNLEISVGSGRAR